MKTIKELRDYLLENYVDEDGDLMLRGLDFSNLYGDVYIGDMKVRGDLYQSDHEVKGDLFHGNSKYGGELVERSYSKLLKEITAEELAELGYKLKEIGETKSESRRVR